MMKKEYVKVLTEIDENGVKTPKIITFEDKQWEIDKVIEVKNKASMKVGGIGERYTIQINGHITYLFFEKDKWFVESK